MPILQRGERGDDRPKGLDALAADERGHVRSPFPAAGTTNRHRGAALVPCVLMLLTTAAYPWKCLPSAHDTAIR